ncbi:MAG: hypothetical protein Q7R96_01270 [Nanoarchaeota archaeon]|nr:hypothetical protein [Nanoarchaeota archaeon]
MVAQPLERSDLRKEMLRKMLCKELLAYFLSVNYAGKIIPWHEHRRKYETVHEGGIVFWRNQELSDMLDKDLERVLAEAASQASVKDDVQGMFHSPEESSYAQAIKYIKKHLPELLGDMQKSYKIKRMI